MSRPHRERERHGRAAWFSAAAIISCRSSPQCAAWSFLRRNHKRLRSDVLLREPGGTRGSLGHRRVHSRATTQSPCEAVRCQFGGARKTRHQASRSHGQTGGCEMNPIAGASTSRAKMASLGIGVIGLGMCAIGWIMTPREFFVAYLFAEIFFVGLSLGSLGLLMIHHLTGGYWGYGVRRFLEAAIGNVPLLA